MDILIAGIANLIHYVLQAYTIVIIVAALITWVNPDPYNPIVRFLHSVTEPVFYRVRRLMPFVVAGGFDLSPVVILLLIQFIIDPFVYSMLMRLAFQFR